MENNNNDQSQPPQMENQQMKSESEFSRHNFPMRRIKGIMRSDPDVGMVSTEAQILFSKACEKFIADLTMRSWLHADENKSCTLERSDIFAAVACTSTFDFLVDGLHKDETLTVNDGETEVSIGEDFDEYFADTLGEARAAMNSAL